MSTPDKPIEIKQSLDAPFVSHEDLDRLYDVLSPYVGKVTHEEWMEVLTAESAAGEVELLDTLHTYLMSNPDRIQTPAQLRRIVQDIKVILKEGPPQPRTPGEEMSDEDEVDEWAIHGGEPQ